jgi:hypothetical protein
MAIKDSYSIEPCLPKEVLEMVKTSKSGVENLGVDGDNYPDIYCKYNHNDSEHVIKNYDSYVTLGSDVGKSGPGSGYSSLSSFRSNSICMTVGRVSSNLEVNCNPNIYVCEDYKNDAAKITISQRTDVDDYYDIAEGKAGMATSRSAVAIKADGIRLIARESIKITTEAYGGYNSQTGKKQHIGGIELIAGNDDSDLQPIPKGDNLTEALKSICSRIDAVCSIVQKLAESQVKIYTALSTHFHTSVPTGGPTTPSFDLLSPALSATRTAMQVGISDILSERMEGLVDEINAFNPVVVSSINSDHNRTS